MEQYLAKQIPMPTCHLCVRLLQKAGIFPASFDLSCRILLTLQNYIWELLKNIPKREIMFPSLKVNRASEDWELTFIQQRVKGTPDFVTPGYWKYR